MKKYRRFMPHNAEEWCKVWRKTDYWLQTIGYWLQKWHEQFGEFDVLLLSIAYKVSAKKVQKNYQELSLVTLKEDLSFRWELTFYLKNDRKNLVNFNLSSVESLRIFILMGYVCRKYVMFELKRCRGVVSWKMTYVFKNIFNNLVNFHTSSWK